LCLGGAEKRPTLMPIVDGRLLALDLLSSLRGGPGGLAGLGFAVGPSGPGGPGKLAEYSRKYAAIAGKNVFLGNAAGTSNADVTELTFLTDITSDDTEHVATLQNSQTNAKTRLSLDPKDASFRIMNGAEVRLEGKVISMGDREVYFRSGGQCYAISVGR